MKIGIIGTGIAGNTIAYKLREEHDITVFESAGYVGGHTATVEVQEPGRVDASLAVDTGFIVYNDRTYPEFCQILDALDVPTKPSDMSFSVRCDRSGLEYNGTSINALFAQRRNLMRPGFYRMIGDILRFNREAPAYLEQGGAEQSLGDFVATGGYSDMFRDKYLLPMGAAIWSATRASMLAMPSRFFIRFFQNHGLLSLKDRPVWRVIEGGSREYVRRMVEGHRDRILLGEGVASVVRRRDGIIVRTTIGRTFEFDYLFVACHSDDALALLEDPSPAEREVLGAINYQDNEVVLHTDAGLLPRRKRAWAAWNVRAASDPGPARLTYNMNILQGHESSTTYCVTLNDTRSIDPGKILHTANMRHPVFTESATAAQQRQQEINGPLRTYYCGAYWRNGFHEDGVVSALKALEHFEQRVQEKCEAESMKAI
ncbi:NAD(P)/FAD-dependent oxidoreductase [Biformimicrobium ophioploci]|uniref:FAD-dependent oxidoreductase n=1 Tax=Biformimicrobium ophioploci TaxID=3036711 RepID=A0ABQ6LYV4_9GAMM|nr:FAD-dependent oxidoreductase [Microbulbifer sp. NKW57]GMG87248.1 FAD-dependent oxidoreductase [Microbulbifer sp. NKW57]